MKINSVSPDFPLAFNYSNISPIKAKPEKVTMKMFPEIKNGYNNESPDFLLIDSMKENKSTYKNRFLGDVIKEDRNAFLKNLRIARNSIKMIDTLKTRKEYSQDIRYLKCIASLDDLNLMNQRQQINTRQNINNLKEPNVFFKLDKENQPENLKEKLKKIHYEYTPKHNYRFKHCLDMNSLDNNEHQLKLKIDPRKSTYLSNFNDYNITENFAENGEKFLKFRKKNMKSYNCITDKNNMIQSSEVLTRKWDTFFEK